MKYIILFSGLCLIFTFKNCTQPAKEKSTPNDTTEVANVPASTPEDSVIENEEMEEVEVASGSN